jgi:hypothetical protein
VRWGASGLKPTTLTTRPRRPLNSDKEKNNNKGSKISNHFNNNDVDEDDDDDDDDDRNCNTTCLTTILIQGFHVTEDPKLKQCLQRCA